jgi:hypothetical protein
MFPQGGPGIALVLLRLSVAAAFLLNAQGRLSAFSTYLLIAAIWPFVTLLILGFLTPISAVVACVSGIAELVISPQSDHSTLVLIVASILNAAALALLGPGAYSLDAWLFGRRVMVIPPRNDKD